MLTLAVSPISITPNKPSFKFIVQLASLGRNWGQYVITLIYDNRNLLSAKDIFDSYM